MPSKSSWLDSSSYTDLETHTPPAGAILSNLEATLTPPPNTTPS